MKKKTRPEISRMISLPAGLFLKYLSGTLCGAGLLFLFFISGTFNLSGPELWHQSFRQVQAPYQSIGDYFEILQAANTNLYVFFYLFFLCALLSAILLNIVTGRFLKWPNFLKNPKTLLALGICGLLLATAADAVKTFKLFQYEKTLLTQKTEPERKTAFYGEVFTFAQYCHRHLPGRHQALLVSDLNFQETIPMTLHRHLRYQIYPISIQKNITDDHDSLIFFFKKNPHNHIPPGYTALPAFNETCLIAVRKNSL